MSSLAERFRRVAEERLSRLSQSLVKLETTAPDVDKSALNDLLRELHTLKGEAGVLGLRPLGSLAHAMEDLLGAGQRQQVAFGDELFDLALAGLDVMTSLVNGAGDEGTAARYADEIRAYAEGGEGAADLVSSPSQEESPQAEPAPARAVEANHEDAASSKVPEMSAPSAASAGRVKYLRVDPQRMSRLSELASDLLVFRERNNRRGQRLEALFGGLRRRHTGASWLKELEDLTRESSQDAFLESRRVRELGDQLRMLRLSPVRELLLEYRRTARDLARALQKKVQLDVKAQAVEVDQAVLEVLSEPLLHLVRNAVSHGIEPPAEREAQGKDPTGRIMLSVRQAGSSVEIVVRDDGRGVDPRRVAEQACARGLLTEDEGSKLSSAQALELIFEPGLSTAAVSEISGRGIGLDVVRGRVEEHHGSVRVESRVGEGTTFVVRIPMDVAMAKALICEAAGSHFAVAADAVERVIEFDPAARRSLGDRQGVLVDGRTVPLCSLRSFLRGEEPVEIKAGAPVVLAVARDRLLALVPDAVLGQRDVAYRPLDAFLSELEAVQGSCLLADGSVALLLNPVGLLLGVQAASGAVRASARPAEVALSRTILVVEDSAITRELVVEIVQNAGYRSVSAENGLEALEQLSLHQPSLVLTDLEMPRMDGIQLTKRIRAQERGGARLPIVVITTRASEEERRACLNAGADAFLDKAQFHEATLVEAVRRLIG